MRLRLNDKYYTAIFMSPKDSKAFKACFAKKQWPTLKRVSLKSAQTFTDSYGSHETLHVPLAPPDIAKGVHPTSLT